MQRPSDLVVLLETRAAAQNLGKPELANRSLHMANFALCWRRRLDPLGGLPANTTYHIGMSERFRAPLRRLDAQR
jgi:hypothetical protein